MMATSGGGSAAAPAPTLSRRVTATSAVPGDTRSGLRRGTTATAPLPDDQGLGQKRDADTRVQRSQVRGPFPGPQHQTRQHVPARGAGRGGPGRRERQPADQQRDEQERSTPHSAHQHTPRGGLAPRSAARYCPSTAEPDVAWRSCAGVKYAEAGDEANARARRAGGVWGALDRGVGAGAARSVGQVHRRDEDREGEGQPLHHHRVGRRRHGRLQRRQRRGVRHRHRRDDRGLQAARVRPHDRRSREVGHQQADHPHHQHAHARRSHRQQPVLRRHGRDHRPREHQGQHGQDGRLQGGQRQAPARAGPTRTS